MTDEPDSFEESTVGEHSFDDPAHASVRDLLASARLDQPIPADVAARLDATLAELTRTSVGEDEAPAKVVPLRRRSSGPRLLAAAAVIVVAGVGAVGVGQVLGNQNNTADSSAGSVPQSDVGGTDSDKAAVPGAPGTADERGLVSSLDGLASNVPVLTSADFAAQAGKLDFSRLLTTKAAIADQYANSAAVPQDGTATVPGATPSPSTLSELSKSLRRSSLFAVARACRGPAIKGTTSYPIVFDDQAAVLVLHRPDAGIRLVEAWSCDGSKVLAFADVSG